MKPMRKSILTMQSDLNKLLETDQRDLFTTKIVYNLSLKLDKEIVKYYREVMNR